MQKISPFFWFDTQAEEAVDFWVSVFRDGRKGRVTRYSEAFADRAGTAMTVNFSLFGHEFIALNGGPQFKFTPAISMMVHCGSQSEVDELWEKLTEGGKPGQCGWLEDKFGLSWQIVPDEMFSLLSDPLKGGRAMQAMLTMSKIDVNEMKRASEHQGLGTGN